MKKKDYLTPHMKVVDVNTEHVLLAGSMGINAGDTGIIDGGGGDEPALSPLFGSELDNELFL